MGNDRHVTDVGRLVHKCPDLHDSLAALIKIVEVGRSGVGCVYTSSTVKLLRTRVLANAISRLDFSPPWYVCSRSITLEVVGSSRSPDRHIASVVREVDLLDHLCGVVKELLGRFFEGYVET